jgi:Icc-related predicted phosphoesterase
MRFLLVSDLHYALQQYDWTTAVAPEFDAVVIAGDHLDGASSVDGGVQIVVILKYLKRLMSRTRLLVSSGNHDLDSRDSGGERVARWMERVRALGIATDGDSIVLPRKDGGAGGTLVTICPWWDGPAALSKVGKQLSRDAARRRSDPTIGAWVWVYHAPPEGSPTCWDGKRHYGDAALIHWIEHYQPELVFTGHIHQAPFRSGGSWIDRVGRSWIFNSGRQIGPTPTHVVVDTEAREAAWFSLQGAEAASLDGGSAKPLPLTAPPLWLPRLQARQAGPAL